MNVPIRLSPSVARKLALERAIELLGKKYLLHPANRVKRLERPYGSEESMIGRLRCYIRRKFGKRHAYGPDRICKLCGNVKPRRPRKPALKVAA